MVREETSALHNDSVQFPHREDMTETPEATIFECAQRARQVEEKGLRRLTTVPYVRSLTLWRSQTSAIPWSGLVSISEN